jgi:hypothetical protein
MTYKDYNEAASIVRQFRGAYGIADGVRGGKRIADHIENAFVELFNRDSDRWFHEAKFREVCQIET